MKKLIFAVCVVVGLVVVALSGGSGGGSGGGARYRPSVRPNRPGRYVPGR